MTTSSADQAPTTLGLRALAIARAELARGAAEEPLGSNAGPDVHRYLAPCVRGGRRLGLTTAPWCAAFASWCVWSAWSRGHESDVLQVSLSWAPSSPSAVPPIGYRASVAEMVADARATGTWADAGEGPVWEVGDLLVWGRDGHDPRHGGEGHVGVAAIACSAICGNDGDRLALVQLSAEGDHPRCGPLLGWIKLQGS